MGFILPTIDLSQHAVAKYPLGSQCSPHELEGFPSTSGTHVSTYTVIVHYQVQELCKQILLTYLLYTADLITIMDLCTCNIS